MLKFEYQILIAFLLDLLIGDPRWFPHPVRFIGKLALALETLLRKLVPHQKSAGILTVIVVLIITGAFAQALLSVAAAIHPYAATAMSIFILYTTLAARDLVKHSHAVYLSLKKNDLPEAQKRVGLIVGRDTGRLDKEGISRAAIESVAESMVDGVTSPLFFAVLGGPLGAILYKAVNTLDSTFGYKNERYINFGWAAARLDDVANFIPARLTAILVPFAALLSGNSFLNSLKILLRDRLKHTSPNAGHTEAAVAGALKIQIGGPNNYFGKLVEKPTIGDQIHLVAPKHIRKANILMLITAWLSLGFFISIRCLLYLCN
jgi:adenosylcobinamide-phosphate synthase